MNHDLIATLAMQYGFACLLNWSIKTRQRTYFLDIQVNKEGNKILHSMVSFVLSWKIKQNDTILKKTKKQWQF